jgi:hypothetical protein
MRNFVICTYPQISSGRSTEARIKWAGHVARMGEVRTVYKVLVGTPKRKRPLGRPRRRWEDWITMDLGEIGWECRVDSIGSGYGPVTGCCDEPLGSGATELLC